MNTNEISKMNKVEKLQTMEAIWDSLIHENISIESPEWHRDILLSRKKGSKKAKPYSALSRNFAQKMANEIKIRQNTFRSRR